VLSSKHQQLRFLLSQQVPLLVAYSGGVDSAFLLAEAVTVLGQRVVGVIADSPSLPRQALAQAVETAEGFGANLRILHTAEFEDSRYTSNPLNRCYFCKAELFTRMEALARIERYAALAYGENADDAREIRPGSQAAAEFQVLSPLRQVGLTKAEIRQLSRERGLPTADKPAQPCLSSRIPHGTQVTRERLALVEEAEERVRRFGLQVFRVRLMISDSGAANARVQIAPAELSSSAECLPQIVSELLACGFSDVFIDPEGYRPPQKSS
jgi:pyridinium-3,5-biscarboxylic acid mononucleotide sulfurtransferase